MKKSTKNDFLTLLNLTIVARMYVHPYVLLAL